MGRTRKDCPLCPATGLLKLSNHLSAVHDIPSSKRRSFISTYKHRDQVGGGGGEPMDSSNSDDGSTDTEDEENLTADTSFESSCSESSCSDHSESSDDDDEVDPWEAIVDEVFDLHRAQMKRRVHEIQNEENISKEKAHKLMRKELSHELNQTFRDRYTMFLKRVQSLKRDTTYQKINDTAKRLRMEDDMDWEESIEEAVNKRKVLLARELTKWKLEDTSDSDSNDDDMEHGDDEDGEEDDESDMDHTGNYYVCT